MATYWMDLAGGSGSGTQGDPWSYADYLSAKSSLVNGDLIRVKGVRFETGTSPSQNNRWFIWDKWIGEDPWRITFSIGGFPGGFDIRNIVLKNGVIYGADGLGQMGFRGVTPNPAEFNENVLIQQTAGNLEYYASQPFTSKGCSIRNTSGNFGFFEGGAAVNDFIDCTFDISGSIAVPSAPSFTTQNCSFNKASSPGNHTSPQWNWPAGVAWPVYDAIADLFLIDILGATLGAPAVPGAGAPTYTGYETGPWGNPRNNISGFSFPPVTDHSVNFSAGANGSITGDTAQTIADGADSTPVTAVPDTNYHFSAWSGDNTSTDNPLTLTNVTSDKSCVANFAIDTYAVNFYAGANGSLTGDATQTVNHGASSTAVTAVPDTGAAFTAWSGDNTSTDNPLTVTGVTSAMDMTANFSLDTYTVTFNPGDHGDLFGSTSQTIAHGGSTTAVEAQARKNFDFLAWSGDSSSTENPLTVTNVTGNMVITATYVKEFSKGKIFSGKRGGLSITIGANESDGTKFLPGEFARRGITPMNWGFPE